MGVYFTFYICKKKKSNKGMKQLEYSLYLKELNIKETDFIPWKKRPIQLKNDKNKYIPLIQFESSVIFQMTKRVKSNYVLTINLPL